MKKQLLGVAFSLFAVFSMQSCAVYGLTNDYTKLDAETQKHIHKLTDFSHLKDKEIYEISGLQLKNELAKNDKSIVYIFVNGCSSKLC